MSAAHGLRGEIERAIRDEAPVWDHTFPEGNTGLVCGVPDAALVASKVAALRLHELEDERDRLLAEAKVADRVDGELRDRHDEFLEAIGARIPEEYDGEDAMESIVLRWLDDLIRQRDEAAGKLDALCAEWDRRLDVATGKLAALRDAVAAIANDLRLDALEGRSLSPRKVAFALRALLAADMSTPDGTTTAETSKGDER